MKNHTLVPALLSLLLIAALDTAASPMNGNWTEVKADNLGFVASFPVAPAVDELSIELSKSKRVSMQIYMAGTPDESYIVATIGKFPFDLNEIGKDFLKPEFFEHFWADTFALNGSDARSRLRLRMLPRESEAEQECVFTFGEVSGHMRVIVSKRRVFVACAFTGEAKKHEGDLTMRQFFGAFRLSGAEQSARLD
jgi:hypothetical protein